MLNTSCLRTRFKNAKLPNKVTMEQREETNRLEERLTNRSHFTNPGLGSRGFFFPMEI